jgi:hypothetical protein
MKCGALGQIVLLLLQASFHASEIGLRHKSNVQAQLSDLSQAASTQLGALQEIVEPL